MLIQNIKHHFIFLLILSGFFCSAQQYNTDSLFNQFKKDALIAWDDETQESYYMLVIYSLNDNLLKYTEDSIPIIRAKIFSTLLFKNTNDTILQEILAKHTNDTAQFTEGGHASHTRSVYDDMNFHLTYKRENGIEPIDFKGRLEDVRRKNKAQYLISGIRHNRVPKNSLVNLEALIHSSEDINISSFELVIRDKSFKSDSNLLTKHMKRAIRRLVPGERIAFIDIKALIQPDNKKRLLANLSLRIE